ncbi:MAG: radical SAM protein [Candidatus Omnitrophota bacterium]
MQNRKILFVNTCILTIKQYHANRCYPMGLMSLAAYVRQFGHTDLSLLDFNLPGKFEQLEEYLIKENPAVVGLSGLTIDKQCIHHTARRVKAWNPDCLVICGGPYASASWNKVVEDPNIDIAVIGEGELTFLDILEKYFDGRDLSGIPGTAVRSSAGDVIKPAPREPIMDLDNLPYPAYDMVDLDFYARTESLAPIGCRPYIAIFSSRACPYRCTYCHDIFGKTFRAMSPEKMVEQIEYYIAQYKIRDFEFIDDIWNLDKKRAVRFCELVIEKKLDIAFHFPNGVRMDLMDEQILTLLKKAGCRFMAVAVESADKAMQKQIKKNNKLEKIKDNIAIADRLGIFMLGFFMIGFTNETYKQMLKTCYFMITSRLTVSVIHSVTPFEGTELYKETKKCEDQNFNVDIYHSGNSRLTKVPGWLINATRQLSYILYYSNPVRVYKVLTRYPYKSYLPYKTYMFISRSVLGIRRDSRENMFDAPPKAKEQKSKITLALTK